MKLAALPSRYIEKIAPSGDCWVWIGCKIQNGYGRIRSGRKLMLAHRAVYELLVGPIPEGLTLDHLCRNRACVNPAHLEPVTTRVNALRGIGPTAINAAKVACINGHPLVQGGRQRICIICERIAHTSHYEQSAGKAPRNPRLMCGRGHPFDAENTIINHGRQLCRACARQRMVRFKEKRRCSS